MTAVLGVRRARRPLRRAAPGRRAVVGGIRRARRLGGLRGSRVLEIGCGTGPPRRGARRPRARARCGPSTPPRRWSSARRRSASTPASRAPRRSPSRPAGSTPPSSACRCHLVDRPARARAGRAASCARAGGSRSRATIRRASTTVWFTEYFPSVPAVDGARFPGEGDLARVAAAGFGEVDVERLRQRRSISRERGSTSSVEGVLDVRPPAGRRVRARASRARRPSCRSGSTTTSTGSSPPRRLEAPGVPAGVAPARAGRARDASARQRHGDPGLEPRRDGAVDRRARQGRHRPLLEADDRPRVLKPPLVSDKAPGVSLLAVPVVASVHAIDRGSHPIWLRTWALSNLGEVPFQPPSVPFGIARSHALVLFRITRLNRLTILPIFQSLVLQQNRD